MIKFFSLKRHNRFITLLTTILLCTPIPVSAEHESSASNIDGDKPAKQYALFTDSNPFPSNDGSKSSLLNFSGRIGYGSKSTGGAGGRDCIVYSLADRGEGSLRACLQNDEPTWVKFEVAGLINLTEYIYIGSNKTIDGRNSNITLGGEDGILCEDSSNIIIHNIRIQGVGTGVRLSGGCSTVWLDHLHIDNGDDEGIAIVNGATDVTVSWSRIKDTDKAILIGRHISDTKTIDTRVTIHHNVLAADQRNPNARYAKVHMFNNLIRDYIYEGTVASQKSEIRSERNIFTSTDRSIFPEGLMAMSHNVGDEESGQIWSFEDQFSIDADPIGNVLIASERIGFDIPYEYWAEPMTSDVTKMLLDYTGWLPPTF